MAVNLSTIKTSSMEFPPRIITDGGPGVGKTTFAASAPSPIFIQTEDGLGMLTVPTFGLATAYADVDEALNALLNETHEYKTVVIDSLAWLDTLINNEVARANGKSNIEKIHYGKGYGFALDIWMLIANKLNRLRVEKGMIVILIGHSQIKRYNDPENEPYDRHELKLSPKAAQFLQEYADIILFANRLTTVTKIDVGIDKQITKPVGGTERYLYSDGCPSYMAKNRHNMTKMLPMTWAAFMQDLTKSQKNKEQHNGIGNQHQ